jgi:hypothetical protein
MKMRSCRSPEVTTKRYCPKQHQKNNKKILGWKLKSFWKFRFDHPKIPQPEKQLSKVTQFFMEIKENFCLDLVK